MELLHYDIKLKAYSNRKDFWQKVWLAQRYVRSLGFNQRNNELKVDE